MLTRWSGTGCGTCAAACRSACPAPNTRPWSGSASSSPGHSPGEYRPEPAAATSDIPASARAAWNPCKRRLRMRVLVTGAAGYIGYAVGRRLVDAGHDVIGLVRRPAQARQLPHDVVPAVADLLDFGNLRAAVTIVAHHELGGPLDGVCHLAGLARVRQSFAEPLSYFAANVHGTVNLLRCLPVAARVVFGSTGAVYGAPDVQPITEAQPPAPTSPYAASKLAAEEALRYHVRATPAGAVVLRTFNVAGGMGASVRDVVAMVAEVTGRPVPTVSAPPTPKPPVLVADSSAIRDTLGWTPKRSDLRQIIADAWAARQQSAGGGPDSPGPVPDVET